MKHIELVLTDQDIEVLQHILAAQIKTFEEMLKDGRITEKDKSYSKTLISTFNSLWWKFEWALNPKEAKKK